MTTQNDVAHTAKSCGGLRRELQLALNDLFSDVLHDYFHIFCCSSLLYIIISMRGLIKSRCQKKIKISHLLLPEGCCLSISMGSSSDSFGASRYLLQLLTWVWLSWEKQDAVLHLGKYCVYLGVCIRMHGHLIPLFLRYIFSVCLLLLPVNTINKQHHVSSMIWFLELPGRSGQQHNMKCFIKQQKSRFYSFHVYGLMWSAVLKSLPKWLNV